MHGYKYVLNKHMLKDGGGGSGTDSEIYFKRDALYWRGDGEQPNRSKAVPKGKKKKKRDIRTLSTGSAAVPS